MIDADSETNKSIVEQSSATNIQAHISIYKQDHYTNLQQHIEQPLKQYIR